jgi:hypothetical protein
MIFPSLVLLAAFIGSAGPTGTRRVAAVFLAEPVEVLCFWTWDALKPCKNVTGAHRFGVSEGLLAAHRAIPDTGNSAPKEFPYDKLLRNLPLRSLRESRESDKEIRKSPA